MESRSSQQMREGLQFLPNAWALVQQRTAGLAILPQPLPLFRLGPRLSSDISAQGVGGGSGRRDSRLERDCGLYVSVRVVLASVVLKHRCGIEAHGTVRCHKSAIYSAVAVGLKCRETRS